MKEKNENHQHKPGDKKMGKAYELANSLLRDRLETEDQENIELLETVEKTDIIVIAGTYDHIHLVLEHMGIPFVHVNQSDFLNLELRPNQVVFINCAAGFPPEGARKLAGFVADGGLAITTDWALKYVLETGFPGMVEYNQKPTADEVVRIEVLDKEDKVLSGFFDEQADPVWWLEGSSYPIKVLSEKVKVLVRSKELKEKYEEEPVIIRFEHGKGTVYHMISHFYLQRTETREAKQKMKASEYAKSKGASAETMAGWEAAEAEMEEMDYGTAQSAATSAEFVSRLIIKQKKKYKK